MNQREPVIRELLLTAAVLFVARACNCVGVRRIALIGSLTTLKPAPKDADLLVSVDDATHLAPLAAVGRRLISESQNRGDVFLANPRAEYLGRLCHYRECRPRVACGSRQCAARHHLCDDHRVMKLPTDLIETPPIELWPTVIRRIPVPEDVETLLLRPLELVKTVKEPESPRP